LLPINLANKVDYKEITCRSFSQEVRQVAQLSLTNPRDELHHYKRHNF